MRFDAILFDAGGVLVVPDPAVLGPVVAAHCGRDDEATLVRAHFHGVHTLDHANLEGEDWLAYHAGYVRAAGVPRPRQADAARATAETLDHPHWRFPVAEAAEVLVALHERGVPVGVVSNAAGQIEALLAEQLHTPMTCVVDSHVVGVSKPDPAIFDHALPSLGLPPGHDRERVAYVGDTVRYDVRAALAAGLAAVMHDPEGLHSARPVDGYHYQPIARLADLLG